MKKTLLTAATCSSLVLALTLNLHAVEWRTDFEKVSEEAEKSHRYMLLDFSGSDWCGWCIRLDDEVFSESAFDAYAEENLICVLLDFPRRKRLDSLTAEQNKALAAKYGVKGFPTVVILAPDGGLVARTGYQKGGAEAYVEHLKSFIDPHREKNGVPKPVSGSLQKTGLRRLSPTELRKRTVQSLPMDESREVRTWTAASGSTVEASLLAERGHMVILKKEDGTQVKIPKSRLSDGDLAYIAKLREQALSGAE